jgi:hypothetical protein
MRIIFLVFILFRISQSVAEPFPQQAKKEVILSVLLNPDDKHIAEEANANRARLSSCGYDVVKVDTMELSAISEVVRKSPPESLLMIDSHGFAFENGSFVFIKPGAPREPGRRGASLPPSNRVNEATESKHFQTYKDYIIFTGNAFATAMDETGKRPKIWLDTCYAGYCPIPRNCQAGRVCSFGAAVSQFAPVTSLLIDLLCSKNSNCLTWKEVDKNGDGVVSSLELEARLKKLAGGVKATQFMAKIVEYSSPEIPEFRSDCSKLGGKVHEEALGFPFEILSQVTEDGETVLKRRPLNQVESELASLTLPILRPEGSVPTGPYAISHFASSLEEAKRIAANNGDDSLDVRQLSQKRHSLLQCTKELPLFEKASVHEQSPNVNGITLVAPQCALSNEVRSKKSKGTLAH